MLAISHTKWIFFVYFLKPVTIKARWTTHKKNLHTFFCWIIIITIIMMDNSHSTQIHFIRKMHKNSLNLVCLSFFNDELIIIFIPFEMHSHFSIIILLSFILSTAALLLMLSTTKQKKKWKHRKNEPFNNSFYGL